VQAADYFKQLPLLRDLGPDEIVDVLRIARVVRFAPGDKLCTRGERGDCAFLLEQGSASVRIADGAGRAIEVARVGPGEVLGELALVDGHPRSADVVALTEVRGYRIDRSEFDDMRRALHPAAFKILRRIAITVSDRLRDINDAIAAELASPAARGAAVAAAAETPQRVSDPGRATRAGNRASRELGRVSLELGRAPAASAPQSQSLRARPSEASEPNEAAAASSLFRSVIARLRGVSWS
jgi:CRP-like cAMP-binding protein